MLKFIYSFGFLLCVALCIAQNPTIEVQIAKDLQSQVDKQGKLYLFVTKNGRSEPRFATWPGTNNEIFVTEIADWDPSKKIVLNEKTKWGSTSNMDLSNFEGDAYSVQVLYYFKTDESRINSPGNYYSQVLKNVNLNEKLSFTLKHVVPDHELIDHKHLKEIEITSKVLSDFWGKEMKVKAALILPNTYFNTPNTDYPLRINIAGYGGRYTRANNMMRKDSRFEEYWMGDDCPQMLSLILDGEGPFGDCYQLDSDNSGPYGEMLTKELIPYVEDNFRGIGNGESRYVDGCSTGGWVSLALQLYYPDYFNGCFSYSPDAVDFSRFQLINIYKDDNAFINEYGMERPVARTVNGEPNVSMRDFIQFENVLGKNGTYVTSGGQFSAFTALYGPRGKDNLPIPLFDPVSGKMNKDVAEHWVKYDLKKYTEDNWSTIGPKLQGKIWVWMGDMDNFYLNMAMRSFDEMLKEQKSPSSDADINFSAMEGHCWQYSHIGVVEQIGQKINNN